MKTPMFQHTKLLDYSYLDGVRGRNMTRPHYHDGYEIYFQDKGIREIFFRHDNYLLKPNTVCIIPPHVFHATREHEKDGEFSRYLINFSPSIFESFLNSSEIKSIEEKIPNCIMVLNEEQSQTIKTHYENMHEYWMMHLSGVGRSKKLAYMEVYRLLDSIIRMVHDTPELLDLSSAAKISDSEIYDVLLYIDNHYGEEISPADMMELSHMSKSNFYRVFKRITGDSFAHYLNRLRLSKAHALLCETSAPIHEIAECTGFSSTAHFTRIFNEVHGVSPSEMRRGMNISQKSE